MKRSAVLGIALLGALGGSPINAQQAGKTYRVGILFEGALASNRGYVEAFLGALAGIGYREGRNLEILYRGANDFDATKLQKLAAELVRAKPDLIVAGTTPVIAAAKRATTSIPIVMVTSGDPVGSGFVASLARPGGNVTGSTNLDADLTGKRLQLLKELVPRMRRVTIVRNPSNSAQQTQSLVAERAARTFGVVPSTVDFSSSDDIAAALKTIPSQRADAMLMLAGSGEGDPARVARIVAAERLPAVYTQAAFTTAGGLMSYGPSQLGLWRQAAIYADRILKGAKPADLPVERPTTFDLVVNLKTAHSLGITVPQSILLQATQVIR